MKNPTVFNSLDDTLFGVLVFVPVSLLLALSMALTAIG